MYHCHLDNYPFQMPCWSYAHLMIVYEDDQPSNHSTDDADGDEGDDSQVSIW